MSNKALFIKHIAKPGRRDDLRLVWEKYVRNYVATSDGQPAYFYCYDDNDPDVILVFQTHANAASAGEFTRQPWYADYERESAALTGGASEYRTATPQWVKNAAG